MKAKDLIAELQKLPEDAIVICLAGDESIGTVEYINKFIHEYYDNDIMSWVTSDNVWEIR